MSVESTNRVWKYSKSNGTACLVLLAIGDIADDDGYAWPRIKNLAEKARVSESTVKRTIKSLLATGTELQVWDRATLRGVPTSSVYRVVCGLSAEEIVVTLPEDVLGRMGWHRAGGDGFKLNLRMGSSRALDGSTLGPTMGSLVNPQELSLEPPVEPSESSSIPLLSLEGQDSKAVQQLGPQDLLDLWNEIVKEPRILKLTNERRKKAKLRMEAYRDREPEFWQRVMEQIIKTPFLRGENDRGWRADFDWLIHNDENVARVLEGKYEKRRRFERTAESRKREIMEDLVRQRAEGKLP